MSLKTRQTIIQESVDENGLSPESLVGSYFHAYDDGLDPEYDLPTSQGRVVAEPAPALYLVEFFDVMGSTSTHQEVVGLDRIATQHWRLYDNQEWMQNEFLNLSTQMRAAS